MNFLLVLTDIYMEWITRRKALNAVVGKNNCKKRKEKYSGSEHWMFNCNLQTSKAPLEGQVQGTSLFMSTD